MKQKQVKAPLTSNLIILFKSTRRELTHMQNKDEHIKVLACTRKCTHAQTVHLSNTHMFAPHIKHTYPWHLRVRPQR